MQLRLYHRLQIERVERFGDVSHGTQAQTGNLFVHIRFGGDENHRDMTEQQVLLDGLAEVIARHLAHDDIAEDEIRLHLLQVFKCFFFIKSRMLPSCKVVSWVSASYQVLW